VSVADIVASVEASEAGAGNVLFVRFYEGDGAAAVGLGGSKDRPTQQRLQVGASRCLQAGWLGRSRGRISAGRRLQWGTPGGCLLECCGLVQQI